MKNFVLRVPVLLLLLPAVLPIVLTPYIEVNKEGGSATLDGEANEDGAKVEVCASVDAEGQPDTSKCITVRFCINAGLDVQNALFCPPVLLT